MSVKLMKVRCDDLGRIYLTDELRARHGRTFVIVQGGGRILLLPVPENPVRDVKAMGKALQGTTLTKLKRGVERRAAREARGLRRR